MSVTASATNLIGFTLEDRYRIVREIGRGGMGVVYEAEHVQLGKRVAVKLMLDKYAEDGEAVSRFRREALAASTIGNSHIIDVSHIGKAPDGRPFVVMELLIGQPLSQVIETTGPMAHWRAIHIIRQVLRAVGAAHAKGIVHRDLKPDNIYLVEQDDQRDFVKLLDFGISKMMDGEGAVAHTKLTTTGMVMGTPLYMAPEQAMGSAIDHHADIYACGVILYEMLSGRPPFEGATFPVLIAKLLTTEPTPILERVPSLPARLVTAVHRALEKDPNRRWPSCEAFYQALPMPSTPSQIELAGTVGLVPGAASMQMQHIALPTPMGQSAQHPPVKRRTGLWIALAAAAGVAVAGAVVAATMHQQGPSAPPTPPTVTATALPSPSPSPTRGSAAAAAPSSPPPPTPTPVEKPAGPSGKLHVEGKGVTPADSTLIVDGKTLGPISDRYPLAAGTHHIRVEHDGFTAFTADVDIAEDETTALPVTLAAARPVAIAPVGHPPLHGPGSSHNPIVAPPHETPTPPVTVPHETPTPPRTTPPTGNTPKPNPYGD